MSAEAPGLSAQPGIHRGLSFDEYASIAAVNAHTLSGFSRTPAHVYYSMLHGGEDRTPQLDLGWYLHLAVLQPEVFASSVVTPPQVDKRTKAGKAVWAKFEAENAGKYLLDEGTLAKVVLMKEALFQHPTAAEFFGGRGQNELSIVWEDKEHGVLCKARMDRIAPIGEWPIVGDLKSAANAGRREFERAIHRFNYHLQAAHYLSGLEALVPIPAGQAFRRFCYFVVESEPPHCVAVFELDDAALEEARILRSKYLRTWKECTESGQWPGYAAGIDYVSLPAYAFKEWRE